MPFIQLLHIVAFAETWRRTSFISMNWAGVPLRNYDIILKYIASTTTKQGLNVNAILNDHFYKKGIKISDEQMKEIKIEKYHSLPQWNYSIFY